MNESVEVHVGCVIQGGVIFNVGFRLRVSSGSPGFLEKLPRQKTTFGWHREIGQPTANLSAASSRRPQTHRPMEKNDRQDVIVHSSPHPAAMPSICAFCTI